MNVYQSIFGDYKEIYNKSKTKSVKQKMTRIEIVAFIGIITLTVLAILLIKAGNTFSFSIGIIIFILLYLSQPVLIKYWNEDEFKRRHAKLEESLQNRISPFIDLLEGNGKINYNLDDKTGLDWLEKCCDDTIKDKSSGFPLNATVKKLLPIVTIGLVAWLAGAEPQKLVMFAVMVIVAFVFIFIYKSIEYKCSEGDNTKIDREGE